MEKSLEKQLFDRKNIVHFAPKTFLLFVSSSNSLLSYFQCSSEGAEDFNEAQTLLLLQELTKNLCIEI
jgi:hypothetical protein